MTTWHVGRGKSGKDETYWVKRNGIQSWANQHGYFSLPEQEAKKRIRKNKFVGFYDLRTHDKAVCDASHFKNGEAVGGMVCVDVDLFTWEWRE